MNPIELTCTCCPLGCSLIVTKKDEEYIVTGNKCPRGKNYAIEEVTAPKRVVTSTIRIDGGLYPVIPVKTDKPVPREKIFEIMKIITNNTTKAPIETGDIIVENAADTGANIVASKQDTGDKNASCIYET